MSGKRIVIAKNKKASYEYFLTDDFEAGMVLQGTEIKSIRDHKARITEAYCVVEKDELYVRNMYIEEYSAGSYNNHVRTRDRKLLLNRAELKRIIKKLKDNGVTCVPVQLFISEGGKAKLKISIATGKRQYDKRDDLKKKSQERQILRDANL